jgi:hypothetical protein
MRSSVHGAVEAKQGNNVVMTHQSSGGRRCRWMRGMGEGSYSCSHGKNGRGSVVLAWRAEVRTQHVLQLRQGW